ncbi:MAG TPA: LysM peptidoglycan-binding domain-containing protein [Longimicrobiaceae bacterium]
MRTRTAALAALGLALAAPLSAQTGQGGEYVVRSGDTLWEIARSCLGDPFLWPEVYRLNATVVADPARIVPDQRLVLPACREGLPPQAAFEPAAGEAAFPGGGGGGSTVIAPGDFYRAPVLVRDAEVPAVGRLAERVGPTVIPIGMTPMIGLRDRVYVALDRPGALRPGDAVHFFRRGREVKPFGRVFVSTGIGAVQAVDGSTATVEIRTLYDVVAVNDFAVPAARFPVRAGAAPGSPRQALEGTVVAFGVEHPLQAPEETVFLDQGRAAGLQEGDVFAAYVPRSARTWGTRPEEPVGRMQVVRVTDRTATARITHLEHPALSPGTPVRLVAEMP